MSLIQEALKRQQVETGQQQVPPLIPPIRGGPLKPKAPAGEPPPLKEPLPLPPPLPAEPPQQEPEPEPPFQEEEPPSEPPPGKKNRSTLVIVLSVILLMTGAGIVMVYFAWNKMRASKSLGGEPTPVTSVTSAVAIATQAPPIVRAAAPALPTNTAVETQNVALASNPVPPVLFQMADVKPEVRWPALKLTAIAGKGTRGTARINGKLILVGESIDDVTLVELGEQSVVLEFQSQKQTLKIGGSLP
jgi:hypothetical protein